MRALRYAIEEAAISLWRGRQAGLLSMATIALDAGRLVRDEHGGGYHDESTREFAMRVRAEMGVGPEGSTNGENH